MEYLNLWVSDNVSWISYRCVSGIFHHLHIFYLDIFSSSYLVIFHFWSDHRLVSFLICDINTQVQPYWGWKFLATNGSLHRSCYLGHEIRNLSEVNRLKNSLRTHEYEMIEKNILITSFLHIINYQLKYIFY